MISAPVRCGGPVVPRGQWRSDGRIRYQFGASLREPQCSGGKITGELSGKLGAARLVIDLNRERAAGVDLRYELWATTRLGRDTSRVTEPR
jgi:hypothetical protein